MLRSNSDKLEGYSSGPRFDHLMTSEQTTQNGVLECVHHAALSDIGQRREENQDSHGIVNAPNFRLYIVADGMGGVKGGAIASSLAIEVTKNYLETLSKISEIEIEAAVRNSNTEIFNKGSDDQGLTGMGTTLVGLGFTGRRMYVVNVGDSRAYRIRTGKIKQLTEDHTLIRELLKSGAITPDQAENHPVSHMLTRSLGPTPTIDPDCWLCSDGPAKGDIYLLCSDGLYNLVSSQDMLEIVENSTLEEATQKLVALANARGGTDNITVILIKIDENFPVGPEEFPEEEPSVDDTLELYLNEDQLGMELESNAQHINGEAEGNGVNKHSFASDTASPMLESGVSLEKLAGGAESSARPAHEQVKVEPPKAHDGKLLEHFRFWAPLVVAGLVGGSSVWLIDQFSSAPSQQVIVRSEDDDQVSPPQTMSAEVAKVGVLDYVNVNPDFVPEAQLPQVGAASPDDFQGGTSVGEITDFPGLSHGEVDNISRRSNELKAFVAKLDERIAAIDQPISGKVGELLKGSQDEREKLKSGLEDIRAEIDVATRRLSVWFGRRKRLETTDPINLSNELAAFSNSVKEKKDIFESASWSYMREADVLKYNPGDQAQAKKVGDLARLRKDRMRELGMEVRSTIDSEIANTDKQISELTLKRESVEAQIEALNKDIEYTQVLMSSDKKVKVAKREELIKERKAAQSELDELNQLLFAPAAE